MSALTERTLLHLPVALMLLALLLEGIRLPGLTRVAPSYPAILLDSVLWLAALSGLAAAVTGWLQSHEGGCGCNQGHAPRH